eukprot:193811_1
MQILAVEKKQNDENDAIIQGISDVVQQKQKSYRDIRGLERLSAHNGKFFVTELNNKYDEYEYGYRFFYWKYYKDNNSMYDDAHWQQSRLSPQNHANRDCTLAEWYINKKYECFKDELLQNTICSIPETSWNETFLTSCNYVESEKAKAMACPRRESSAFYEMKFGDTMQERHFIALLLYCNFDKLQKYFSGTYRKLNKTESNRQLKQRHRHFYHFGKNLR